MRTIEINRDQAESYVELIEFLENDLVDINLTGNINQHQLYTLKEEIEKSFGINK